MRKTGRMMTMAVATKMAMAGVLALVFTLVSCGAGPSDAPGAQGVTKNAAKTPTKPIAPEDKRSAEDKAKDFKEDLGGGVTLDMVWVKEGTFKIGSPVSEPVHFSEEGPQTDVTVPGFWMGKTEVTQEQYERLVGTNPSIFKGPKNPVDTVSWNDAMEFCKKLSASKAGRAYTLPTEAQWEYACRAGSTGPFCFGDSESDLESYAWIQSNSNEMTHPVGQKSVNAWGLYDMHGNVWEWCLSQYKPYPYKEDDGRNDASGSGSRVLRNGSWNGSFGDVRSAFRSGRVPTLRLGTGGFRVVCVPAGR